MPNSVKVRYTSNCPTGINAVYSLNAVLAVDTYTWTVPSGATDVSGQGTNTISFRYPAGYTGGSISVTATNGCGTSAARTFNVNINIYDVKEIDDDDCATTVNKFPVNEGFKNFDAIYFLFAILMQIFQLTGSILIVIWNILGALWNAFSGVLAPFVIAFLFYLSVVFFIGAGAAFPAIGLMILNAAVGAALLILGIRAIQNYQNFKAKRFGPIRLPMITYPGCTACDCKPGDVSDENGAVPSSLLTQFSNNGLYFDKINNLSLPFQTGDDGEVSEANKGVVALTFSQAMGTRVEKVDQIYQFKSTESEVSRLPDDRYEALGVRLAPKKFFAYSTSIPMGARINTFNGRKKYSF